MQSLAFRSSRKLLSEVAKNKSQTHPGFVKKVISDPGNIPIILANMAAGSMIFIFGARKILFHPDVTFVDDRFNTEVQNESGKRLDNAYTFREQTRAFARALYQPTQWILRLWLGTDASDKFHLHFLKDTHIPLPLEATNHFDDDLYKGNKVEAFAANLSNDAEFIGSNDAKKQVQSAAI